MPYIGTYAFRFWIKSDVEKTISFSCDTTFKDFNIGQDWSCIQMVFEVDQISNIYIELPIGEYWIYNTKLEVGQYHTDWSPHPEDGNQNYDDKLAEIEQTLIEYRSEISKTQSYVDQVQQQIINSVSKTTYESDIQGLTRSISDRFQNVEEGYDKWYVSFYDKSQFKDTKLDDDMDDRERFDLGVFLLDNSSLNPIDEKLIDDTPASMRVDGRGKVVYYLAFAKFSRTTVINTQMNYNKASLYINGIQVFIAPQQALIGTTNVILNFSAGWNMIEIISNEGNLSFNTKISKHENCEQFNCLVAVPTQHSAKIREQGAYLNIYLDKIVSEVFDSYMEDIYDDQGHYIGQRKVLRSKIEQAADKISLLVESMQTDGQGNVTSLTLTDNAITAITNQFIISDEEGHNVVISGGKILAESITSAMLSTDAIKSRNYVPNEKPLEDESLPINDSDLMEIIQNHIDISDPNYIYDSKLYMIDDEGFIGYSKTGTFIDLANGKISTPSLYIDSTQQKAFFKGTVFADNGIFRGIVYATDGVFKGTVYAESGEFSGGIYADYGVFNGTVYAEDGVFNGTVYATNGRFTGEVNSDVARLGPWILNSTSLYKGTGILGTHGGSNIYLGDAGFSLGDRLIYDSVNESIMLAPSAITFAGRDIEAELDGQQEWYSVGVPTSNNYPAVDWINTNTEAEHVGNFYYDMGSGFAYRYENYSTSNYKISFSSNTDIKANDSLTIYYKHANFIFRVSTTITGTNVPDIVIPTDNFYLHWHTLSGAAVDHYGFAIDSVTKTSDGASLATSQNSLPNIPVDASYTVGVYPETEHPYQSVDQDKMWLVRAANDGSSYVWQRVYNNQELSKIASNSKSLGSFMHYDAKNGLVFYNSTDLLPNRVLESSDFANIQANMRLTADGVGIYNANNLLAKYGSSTIFYVPTTDIQAAVINANGMNIYRGSLTIGTNFSVTNEGVMEALKATIGPMHIGYSPYKESTTNLNTYLSTWIGDRTNYSFYHQPGVLMTDDNNFSVGSTDIAHSHLIDDADYIERIVNFTVGNEGYIHMFEFMRDTYRQILIVDESDEEGGYTANALDHGYIKSELFFLENNYLLRARTSALNDIIRVDYNGNLYIKGSITASSISGSIVLNNAYVTGNIYYAQNNVYYASQASLATVYKNLFMALKCKTYTYEEDTSVGDEQTTKYFGIDIPNLSTYINQNSLTYLSLLNYGRVDYKQLFVLAMAIIQQHESRIAALES